MSLLPYLFSPQCQDLERRQWTLIDEKQRLSTELLRRDPLLSRHLGDGASDPSSQQSGRVSVKGSVPPVEAVFMAINFVSVG